MPGEKSGKMAEILEKVGTRLLQRIPVKREIITKFALGADVSRKFNRTLQISYFLFVELI